MTLLVFIALTEGTLFLSDLDYTFGPHKNIGREHSLFSF
jgi:hypothetical protein